MVPAVVAAAGVGAIGVSFAPWLLLVALAAVVLALTSWESRPALRPTLGWVAVLGAVLVVLGLPTVSRLSQSITLAKSFSTGNQLAVSDPGNLVRPLKTEQLLGVWLTGSHRVDPPGHWFGETYFLLGLAALAVVLGALWLLRRRQWTLVAWVALSALLWLVLTRRGTAWTDAKLLVLTSPVVVLLAGIGVESLRQAGRRFEGALLGLTLAAGILVSNAFTYHDTNLQPTQRYEELLKIGDRFADDRPALVPEFDEFALYALPGLPPDGPGFSFKSPRLVTLRDGAPTPYGTSFDLDRIPLAALKEYTTIVKRRRPDSSRPPANYARVFAGRYYEVWRRMEAPRVLDHLPAGSGLQAAGRVPCERARRLAADARRDGAELRYVPRPRLVTIDPRKASRPAAWGEAPPMGIGLSGPGVLRARATVPAGGRYRIWLKGDIGRRLELSVNGTPVGGVSGQSGNDGNYATPIEATLRSGRNSIAIERSGGSLRPGDNTPSLLRAIVLEPAGGAAPLRSASPSDWAAACRGPVDWVELVRSR